MAVSGDTVVVGAFGEDSDATGVNGDQNDDSAFGAGAAYVFVRNGATWSQQAYLKASNTDAGDVSVRRWRSLATPWSSGQSTSSNATGVNGNQSDNSAQVPGQLTFSCAAARLGASRLISKLPTPMRVIVSAVGGGLGRHRGRRGIWGTSNATGINGNQSDNSAPKCRGSLRFHPQRHDLEPAGLSESFQHRCSNDDFGSSVAVDGDTVRNRG